MDINERSEARKLLKRPDYYLIAQASGITTKCVRDFLRGDSKKSECEPYLIAMVNKRKKDIANFAKSLD